MTSHRLANRIALLFLAASAAPIALTAQDTSSELSARLMRRLAEAVDGDRTGRAVFLVSTTRDPYEVLAAFPRLDAAQEYQREHPATRVDGPYYASPDSGQPEPEYLLAGCYHDRVLTRWRCPQDSTRVASVPVSQIREIVITVVAFDPALTTTSRYTPDHADAFFFTQSAIDKFLTPYYQWVYGAEYAANLRARTLEIFRWPVRR